MIIRNNGGNNSGVHWLTVNNTGAEAEISIYGQIGKGYFSEDGVTAKEFAAALKEIPRNKKIRISINSPGGNVWEGTAIASMIEARKDKVTTCAIGVAASIASVILVAGGKVEVAGNTLCMIHNPSAFADGDAEDMRKAADMLDKVAGNIADAYAKKTGKPASYFLAKMDSETWFTAEEMLAEGLCDSITADVEVAAKFDFKLCRNTPAILLDPSNEKTTKPGQHSQAQTQANIMNRDQIIALLTGRGIKVDNKATDAELLALLNNAMSAPITPAAPAAAAAPAPAAAAASVPTVATVATPPVNVIDLQAQVTALTNARNEERRLRVSAQVDQWVREDRIPAAQRETILAQCVANEALVPVFAALPPRPVGVPPLGENRPGTMIEISNESPEDIAAHVRNLKLAQDPDVQRRQYISPRQVGNSAMDVARFVAKNRTRLLEVMNANTIDANLQRTVILHQVMQAFTRVLLPLNLFSTNFGVVPLEGTDTVTVPYYPLVTGASTDWVPGTGYTASNTTTNNRPVVINKRKFQGIQLTSSELRRQPYLNLQKLAELAANKLALDVWSDILSLVTLANYGAARVKAAAAFDITEIAAHRTVANQADWPTEGRGMVVDVAYEQNLLATQSSLTSALNYGSTDPIQQGTIRNIFGFRFYSSPRIPGNAENLTGFTCFPSAILLATAPVRPTDEVMKLLSTYEIVVDPQTNMGFEYRLFGNAVLDQTTEVIEANYGYAKGEAAALKRITSV